MKKQQLIEGKLPPQAVELEEAILGAMLLENDAIPKAASILQAEDFYTDQNKTIYHHMIEMFNKSLPIDILTVVNYLKVNGKLDLAGGGYYINILSNRVAGSANIEYHAMIVKEKAVQRNIIRVCNETLQGAYETNDVFSMLDGIRNKLDSIGETDISGSFIDAKNRMAKTMEKIKKGINQSGVTGVPCGLTSIDRFTGGFQEGDLIFIGARPGNYKTALIMAMAHKMIPLGFTPYISQQEMAMEQSGMRELAMHSGVNTQDLRRGVISDFELAKLEEAAEKVSKMNVYIDHTGGMKLSQIKANIKKQTKIKRIDILFVDYLQLLNMETKGNYSSDEAVIAATTRKLKLLAKDLHIPVVALSQLSRQVESRTDKRPVMSDFKGSGAIEADADIAILLFNPSKYFADPTDDKGNSMLNKVEVIFCKNRQGQTGSIILDVNPATNTFNDIGIVSHETKPIPRNLNMQDDMEWNKEKQPF